MKDVGLITETSKLPVSVKGQRNASLRTNAMQILCGSFRGFERFVFKRKSVGWCEVKPRTEPFDLAVSCILLRMYMLAPNEFELVSEGERNFVDHWMSVQDLYLSIWPEERVWCTWDGAYYGPRYVEKKMGKRELILSNIVLAGSPM